MFNRGAGVNIYTHALLFRVHENIDCLFSSCHEWHSMYLRIIYFAAYLHGIIHYLTDNKVLQLRNVVEWAAGIVEGGANAVSVSALDAAPIQAGTCCRGAQPRQQVVVL